MRRMCCCFLPPDGAKVRLMELNTSVRALMKISSLSHTFMSTGCFFSESLMGNVWAGLSRVSWLTCFVLKMLWRPLRGRPRQEKQDDNSNSYLFFFNINIILRVKLDYVRNLRWKPKTDFKLFVFKTQCFLGILFVVVFVLNVTAVYS